MTKIEVYDYDAKRIKKLCEEFDLTEAEVIESLFDNLDWDEDEKKKLDEEEVK